MGISGLLPLLKSATEHVPLSRFKGKLIAVDGNVWIHRGTYSCAMELAEGTPTIAYVRFCQKMAEAITSLGVRLLIVFDGRSLPAKGPAHQRRREKRRQAHQALSAIAELTREQEFSMASEEDPERKRQLGEEAGQLQHERERSARNAAHVTDAMVLQVMDALSRLPGVDVLRAPYEADAQLPNPNPNPNQADAQLAFLARADLVHAVLTEDSDLVAYCLPRVLVKFDRLNASAQLIEKARLMAVSVPGFKLKGFTDEMFLQARGRGRGRGRGRVRVRVRVRATVNLTLTLNVRADVRPLRGRLPRLAQGPGAEDSQRVDGVAQGRPARDQAPQGTQEQEVSRARRLRVTLALTLT
jgi:5'-3' exonuclease